MASNSTRPARFKWDPVPASNTGSSSRMTIAASTASNAEPPLQRIFHPASRARRQPAWQSATDSSGMSQAPPCTMSDGLFFWLDGGVLARRAIRSVLVVDGEQANQLKL